MTLETAWIVNTKEFKKITGEQKTVIVDITSKQSYDTHHIPGAIFLEYPSIVKHNPPVMGLIPDDAQLAASLSLAGIKPDDYVIAYDEEGGGKASRLLWTLEIAGHKKMSLLDGGITNWLAERRTTETKNNILPPSKYPVIYSQFDGVADADYILQHMENDDCKILDTRTYNEYIGTDVRTIRAGHIPGAVNIDWQRLKQPVTHLLLVKSDLEKLLMNNGINKSKEVIVHCHSHHRSALAYVALKHLGYQKVKGYPGSWSDWANRSNTPVEYNTMVESDPLVES